jgi:aspartokinase/homoserine dehydrogenase 1
MPEGGLHIALSVLKFGGSCLSNAEGLHKIKEILRSTPGEKAVVLSGIKDSTDLLKSYLTERSRHKLEEFRDRHVAIAQKALTDRSDLTSFTSFLDSELGHIKGMLAQDDEAVPRWVHDHVITDGERIAVHLLAAYLYRNGVPCTALTSEEAGIAAFGEFGSAEADLELTKANMTKRVQPLIDKGLVPFITGFYGILPDGKVATFGRNGSDYSAAVVARTLMASDLILYKDVPGFMSADPSVVPEAKVLSEITFEEAAELSSFGAKVIHHRTLDPIIGTRISLRVLDMNDPASGGTYLTSVRTGKPGDLSVTSKKGMTCLRLNVSISRSTPEVLCTACEVLSKRGMSPISIVTSHTSIGMMIGSEDSARAVMALEEATIRGVARIDAIPDLAIVGLVGGRLEDDPHLLGRCLGYLTEKGVKPRMSGSGGTRIAYYIIVEEKDVKESVRALHDACTK